MPEWVFASATSRSSRFDKHPALRKCSVESCSGGPTPLIHLRLAIGKYVDWPAQIVQCAAQAHHLRVPIWHGGLNDQEVEIAPRSRVLARVRAEQNEPDRRAGSLSQRTRGTLDVSVLSKQR
jgi:hypothetical protein